MGIFVCSYIFLKQEDKRHQHYELTTHKFTRSECRWLVGGTLYCNPPASRGRQTQALLLGASINPAFTHCSQWAEVERLCTNGFEVMTLDLLPFVFSVLQHTLIVATQPIVFFCVPSPNRDLLDILVDFFFHTHICSYFVVHGPVQFDKSKESFFLHPSTI